MILFLPIEMKIERRIILSNVFNIGLILLIGFFAIQDFNRILTKLRFVEIADDLNASFLEMRISEKNYFLYHDDTALSDIKEKSDKTMQEIELERKDIVRAVGNENYRTLILYLNGYSKVLGEVRRGSPSDMGLGAKFRTEGKKLREFSSSITRLERRSVNDIIETSKNAMLFFFLVIFVTAIVVSHFISQRIVYSLREIEKVAESISKGNFHKVHREMPADEFGSVVGAINSMSEELRTREEELIQSKKLASLGILTAGVAHELTNPLNNISMIAQNYIELYDYLSKENRIELIKKVEGETERIGGIVKNLLDFSKPKEANLKKTDINETVRKSLRLMQNTIDISNIEVRMALAPKLRYVFVDEPQIQQVLINLIANAVQAMQPGGTLTIASRPGETGDTVIVDVADTGKGIPPEYIPHVFDPFFSTKGVGGTGLGLSVSYGIVKNHGGSIKVESEVGSGTTFTVELPVYKKLATEDTEKIITK